MGADGIRPMQGVVVILPAPGLTKPLPLSLRFERLLAALELTFSLGEIKGQILPSRIGLKIR
jgi:hypothetical protein